MHRIFVFTLNTVCLFHVVQNKFVMRFLKPFRPVFDDVRDISQIQTLMRHHVPRGVTYSPQFSIADLNSG
jgi:hypothetical protein